jgi:hypothetical protein
MALLQMERPFASEVNYESNEKVTIDPDFGVSDRRRRSRASRVEILTLLPMLVQKPRATRSLAHLSARTARPD